MGVLWNPWTQQRFGKEVLCVKSYLQAEEASPNYFEEHYSYSSLTWEYAGKRRNSLKIRKVLSMSWGVTCDQCRVNTRTSSWRLVSGFWETYKTSYKFPLSLGLTNVFPIIHLSHQENVFVCRGKELQIRGVRLAFDWCMIKVSVGHGGSWKVTWSHVVQFSKWFEVTTAFVRQQRKIEDLLWNYYPLSLINARPSKSWDEIFYKGGGL
jgi:hypothetical protein